jgi:hypothetical protein
MSVQYRIVLGKKDERVDGPDDADVVVTAPFDVVTADGFDATVDYMRGRVKATGHTGKLLELLKSGEATSRLSQLASHP